MKKGRHRRFEEARALKRSTEFDVNDIFASINGDEEEDIHKPEHDAWADLAEEWDSNAEASSGEAPPDSTDDEE